MADRRTIPDYALLTAAFALLAFGLVMVFSASSVVAQDATGDPAYYFKRQLAWAGLGLVGLVIGAVLPYSLWRRHAPWIFLFTLGLLALVLTPVGITSHGASRWLGVGSLAFQPSELAKLATVIFYARWLTSDPRRLRSLWTGIVPFLIILGVVTGLVILEPDLGTAAAIAGTSVAMLFMAGVPILHLLLLGLVLAPAALWAIFAEPYRRERFFAFLDPFRDPLGSGYHIIQALYALGSGGLFGVGLGSSILKRYYLPERHTDFIFAIVGEELGFLGGVFVIALFAVIAWRGYRIAALAPEPFGALLAAGITTMIVLQAVVNMGVVMSVLPITGITLPLVSFGGSSLVFTLSGIGILVNVSRYARHA
ncbi:MAG: putative lipid II flippase FtsW [Clostridia bacterium]|nr:putative lipid II flippase FtsW [Clostridia bacterium]